MGSSLRGGGVPYRASGCNREGVAGKRGRYGVPEAPPASAFQRADVVGGQGFLAASREAVGRACVVNR